MIEITTDSCSDLSAELRQRFGIRAIPLQVYIHGRNVRDGELSLPELFGEVEQYGELPKTSAPPVGDFLEFFDTPMKLFILVFLPNFRPRCRMPFWPRRHAMPIAPLCM